jgi:hypothetical protein
MLLSLAPPPPLQPRRRSAAAPRAAAAAPEPARNGAAIPPDELLWVLERRGEGYGARTHAHGRCALSSRAVQQLTARTRLPHSWAEEIFPHVTVQRRAAPATRVEEVSRRARSIALHSDESRGRFC